MPLQENNALDEDRVRKFMRAGKAQGHSFDAMQSFIADNEDNFITQPTGVEKVQGFFRGIGESISGGAFAQPPTDQPLISEGQKGILKREFTLTGQKEAFKRTAANLKQGALESASGFFLPLVKNVAAIADKRVSEIGEAFEEVPALRSGNVFQDTVALAERAIEATTPKPEDVVQDPSTLDKVMQGVGASPLTLATYATSTVAMGGNPIAGMAAVDALRESDKGLKETIVGGIKGATTGGILHAAGPLAPVAKTAVTAGLFGGLAAAEGGDASDIASSTIIGAGLAQLGPKGDVTAREAVRPVVERARPVLFPKQAKAAAALGKVAEATGKQMEAQFEAVRQISETARAIVPERPLAKELPVSKEPAPSKPVATGVAPQETIPVRGSPLDALQGQKGFVKLPGPKTERAFDIREPVPEKDILAANEFIMSPEFLFKSAKVRPGEWEPGERIAAGLIEKSQEYAYQGEIDKIRFDQIRRPLSQAEQRLMTKMLRGKVEPDAVPQRVREAGIEVRKYKDEIREEFKTYKREMFRRYLSEEENVALTRVIDGGESAKTVAKETKIDAVLLDELATNFKEIDTWGLEDYVTNMERGTFRMVDNDGVTALVALTRKDAVRKAKSYMERHPEVKTLTLETNFGADSGFATLLPRMPALRLRQQIADAIGVDAKAIQQLLSDAGVKIAVKPTPKFAGPTQKRLNILEGEENLFDVLPAYSYAMRKKMSLDPVLADARAELHKLPQNKRAAMDRLIEDVKGRKTVMDRTADQILDRLKVSAKPFAFSRATGKLGTATTWMKLGYRPVAGAVNFASGQTHTWTKVGTKYMVEAAKFLRTPEGRAFAEQEAPHLGISFAQDSVKLGPTTPLHHPLGMFQKAEPINRKMSLAANYLYAKGAYGMQEAEARVFARRSMRFQQFTYDIASLPRIMRGPSGRLIFKFKPYLVKELEFMSTLRGPEIPRYIGAQLAMGGPRAYIYMLKTIPILGSLFLLDDVDEWLNQNYPRASRGIPGYLGGDVSAPVTFQFPQRAEDWLGPTLSDAITAHNQVYVPLSQGEGHITEVAREVAIRTVPAFYNWSLLVQSVMDDEGWIRNYQGKRLFQPTGADRVKFIFGVRPLKLSVQQATTREILREERTERNTRSRALEIAAGHIVRKEDMPPELLEELKTLGVTSESLKNAVMQRVLTPRQRLFKQVGKQRKAQVLEQLPAR